MESLKDKSFFSLIPFGLLTWRKENEALRPLIAALAEENPAEESKESLKLGEKE